MQHFQLSVKVSDILTLDAGWWEETIEETAWENLFPVDSSTRLNRLCTIRCCAIWK